MIRVDKVGECPNCGSMHGDHYQRQEGDFLSCNPVEHDYPVASTHVMCGICREYYEICWITSASMGDLLTAVNYRWHNSSIHDLYKRVLGKGGLAP